MEQHKLDEVIDAFTSAQRRQRELFNFACKEIKENESEIRRLKSELDALKTTLKIVKGRTLRIEMDIMRNEFSNLQDLCVEIKQAIAEEEAS